MKTVNRLLMCVAVCIAAACASPSKLYNSGNYYQATVESVRKLRSSPDKADIQAILVQAYPLAVKTALREVSNASQSNSVTKYDVMINRYEQLNRLADEIYTCPKANQLIPSPHEFRTELQQTKDLAAEHYYLQGTKELSSGTVEQAKLAYQYFVKTNQYINGYRDVNLKINEALYAATLRVVVEAPKMPARFQISADFFYSNLITEMNRASQNRFLRFYTHDEAQHGGIYPHQYIALDFIDFSVGNVRESKNSAEVHRDSVVVSTVEIEGVKYPAYATVKAVFTTYRREILSGGKLHVRIIDAESNSVTEQRSFDGSYVWGSMWGSYKGDDRALSAEQKQLSARQPTLPPPNQDLFIEFTKPIFTQVVNYIQNIYRNR